MQSITDLLSLNDLDLGSVRDFCAYLTLDQFHKIMSDRRSLADVSKGDLAKLVRVATRIEDELGGAGSTTCVPGLIKKLEYKSPSLAEEMKIWAFYATRNPYVPFGTQNSIRTQARSVAEYRMKLQERDRRNAASEDQARTAAEKRRVKRMESQSARLSAHSAENAARAKLIESLAQLEPAQRLVAALDTARPLWSFPEAFAEVADAGPLRQCRDRLLESLVRAPKGRWRALRKKLQELD